MSAEQGKRKFYDLPAQPTFHPESPPNQDRLLEQKTELAQYINQNIIGGFLKYFVKMDIEYTWILG